MKNVHILTISYVESYLIKPFSDQWSATTPYSNMNKIGKFDTARMGSALYF